MANITKCKVESSDKYGRYLVAAEDIKAGEIIFKDTPLVVGPKVDGELVCLDCLKPLLKQLHCCDKCKLAPLCGAACGQHNGWHTSSECQAFEKLKSKIQLPRLIERFHLVTVIRCILLRTTDGDEAWKRFINMESHIEQRRGTGIWNFHENATQILYELGLLNDDDRKLETIQKICGILDVNSYELRTGDTSTKMSNIVCGIYPFAALMAHNCLSNTHLSVDDKFNMVVRASVPINKNQSIYFNYTNVLEGTVKRREHLLEGKYFGCNCERCSDSTEKGTHMSTLKCSHCNHNAVIMSNPLKSTQFTSSDKWVCGSCKREYSGTEIKVVLDEVKQLFEELDLTDVTNIELFLSKALKHLHPNHHTLFEAKHLLAGLLRDILNRSIQQPKKMLLRKIDICREFMPLFDILEPGISRLKALAMYEIHIPMVQLANKDHDAKEINNNEFLEKLIEAERYLKDSIRILLYEPLGSPEGKLCKRAMDELKMLQRAMDDAKSMLDDSKNKDKSRLRKNKKN